MRPRAVLAAGIALIAGAVAVDATTPATPPRPAAIRVQAAGGVLACPAAFSPSGRAYVHLANLGAEEAQAQVRVVADDGKAAVIPVTLAASSATQVRVSGRVKGAGSAFVRYTGDVIASHSVWLQDGAIAATCSPAGPRRLVLANGSTAGARTTLYVANPGRADADVSISLLVGGQRIEPETLNKFIVPAGGRRTFSVGDFAFEAPDVTAVIQANSGRVVAQSQTQDRFGRTLQTAGPARGEAVALIGVAAAPRAVSIAAIGEDEDAAVEARVLEPRQQGAAPGVPPSIVPADSVRLRVSPSAGVAPVAYAVRVTAGSPIGLGANWRRGRGDPAAVEAVGPATAWAGVLGLDQAGEVRALLANPGDAPVAARLSVIRGEGVEVIEVTIDAGRTLARSLGSEVGASAVLVEANGPVAVVLDAIVRGGERMVAAPAVSRPGPDAVAVRQDPQAGVPGRRPGT